MANRGSDPRVREWMNEHKDEVAKVQEQYDALKALSTEELLEMVGEEVRARVRAMLIVGIIKEGAQQKLLI